MKLLLRLLVLGTALTATNAGCSAPVAETRSSRNSSISSESVDEIQAEFERELNTIYEQRESCVADGQCGGDIGTASLRPQGLFDRIDICDALRPLAGLEHPYFFIGGSVSGGAVAGVQGGVDVVWDLWNRQAAMFYYGGGGIMSLVGGEAAVYEGYGFGDKSGVIDAWSGEFRTFSLSVGLPVLRLAAGGSGFSSPDRTVMGGAVSISAGLDWIPTPVDGSLVVGIWTAFDTGTQAIGSRLWFVDYTEETVQNKKYIQFATHAGVAASILQTVPVSLAAAPTAQAVAVGVLRDRGLTIQALCP